LTRLQAARKIPVTVTMMSKTTRWAAPLALTRVLLVGLCVCWPSYTSAESTQRDPSQDQTQTPDAVETIRLAEQGDVGAQFLLGLMYEHGRGVPQDETEAVRWYRLAANQGFAVAQSNLGVMYRNGRGVPQDDVAAHMWLDLATGAQSSRYERDLYVTLRDDVAAGMTPEQIAEAQRLTREWKPTVEP
jgi:TPR repeat protein